ncbi:hypothetical protein J5226_21585 [Lysobacter sp. K5869]|uniref:hypothetical protein n=1 Tax=Lysobacter sp. K5869 TaxID=2820808 RepID=UPI001C061CBA|nr:hypothetical protein [Lysobacter sp. K5869]QWP76151.1 hypothetical protein J5226_21585 [Lysobacter sp. K5869]
MSFSAAQASFASRRSARLCVATSCRCAATRSGLARRWRDGIENESDGENLHAVIPAKAGIQGFIATGR